MGYSYSDDCKRGINNAQILSKQYRSDVIGTEHILLGFLQLNCNVSKRLKEAGVKKEMIQLTTSVENDAIFSERVHEVMAEAENLAKQTHSVCIEAEHIIIALLCKKDSFAVRMLENSGVDVDAVIITLGKDIGLDKIADAMQEKNVFNENSKDYYADTLQSRQKKQIEFERGYISEKVTNSEENALINDNTNQKNDELQELMKFGVDLTLKAKMGKIDPVIGREIEIERLIEILSRRTKNNPILIGESGVGKSAVAEGLAQAIADGNVTSELRNKMIFSFSLADMLAGTRYRGDFEERFKSVIDVISKNGNIIIFIDEIHNIVGAGATGEGNMDAAEILKPLLSRGELQTIGATTFEEYRKFIEKDSALMRRFQPVIVNEPNEEDSIKILQGIKTKYEKHHNVKIADDAIETAVKLSKRYISDRFLPDKAIDLIDEASSRARIKYGSFDGVGNCCDEAERLIVNADDIADLVAKITQIPVSRLTEDESERLLSIENELHKQVVGQNEAVGAVAKAIRRNRAGLKDPTRPIGSFIFLGKTGVGKTELSKALAQCLFGREDALIRLDMSEYMEKQSVSKLIGAPPGYVGYGDNDGQLTEKVRRKPYCVILFDEIEKAHVDVLNILLQILDDGRVSDSKGRVIDFKNAVIIMTSNLCASFISNEFNREKMLDELKKHFKTEFINRIDDIIPFKTLSRDETESIALLLTKSLSNRMRENGMDLSFTNEAVSYLAEKGYDKEFGARPLKRVIQKEAEDPLSEAILTKRIVKGDAVVADVREGNIVFLKKR